VETAGANPKPLNSAKGKKLIYSGQLILFVKAGVIFSTTKITGQPSLKLVKPGCFCLTALIKNY
jgi:hypothetical protein